MIIVEFIGLPGVGKSTLHQKVIQNLQRIDSDRYLSLDEALMRVSKIKIDKIFRLILKCLPYRLALKFCTKLGTRSFMQFEAQNKFIARKDKLLHSFLTSEEFNKMGIEEKTMLVSTFMEIGSALECINGQFSEKTVILLEEGFIQKSFMFVSPSDRKYSKKKNLFEYLNNIQLPNLTIYVNADIRVCHQRMLTRSDGLTNRLIGFAKTDVLNFLSITDQHLDNIVGWLKNKTSNSVLEINNEHDLEDVICTIESRIKLLL